MPKFLDVPSWYDENGTLTTFVDSARIRIGGKQGSSIYVPVTQISGSAIQEGNIPNNTWTVQEASDRYCVLLSNSTPSYGVMWSPAPDKAYSALTYRRNSVGWEPLPKLYAHTGRVWAATASLTKRGRITYNYYSTSETEATSFSGLVSALYSLWSTTRFAVSGYLSIDSNNIVYSVYSISATSDGQLNVYYTDGTTSLTELNEPITSSDRFNVNETVTELF